MRRDALGLIISFSVGLAIALLVLVGLSGCVQDLRKVQTVRAESGVVSTQQSPFSLFDEQEAVMVFIEMWEEQADETPDLDGLKVRYISDRYGTLRSGYRYSGLTLNPNQAEIAWGGRRCVYQTSLIHELVHVALWRGESRDPDGDHSLDFWKAVRPARNTLEERIECTSGSSQNALPDFWGEGCGTQSVLDAAVAP